MHHGRTSPPSIRAAAPLGGCRIILQLRHAARRVRRIAAPGPTIRQRGHLPGRSGDRHQSPVAVIGIGGLVPVPTQTVNRPCGLNWDTVPSLAVRVWVPSTCRTKTAYLSGRPCSEDGGRARRQDRFRILAHWPVGDGVQKEGAIRAFRIAFVPRTTRGQPEATISSSPIKTARPAPEKTVLAAAGGRSAEIIPGQHGRQPGGRIPRVPAGQAED